MRALCLLLTAAALGAGVTSVQPWEITLKGYFDAKDDSDRADLLEDLVSANKALTAYGQFAASNGSLASEAQSQMRAFERRRNDKELSAPTQSTASTALATHAGIPDVIGAAVESGALTQSATGTASTIRVKPLGIYDLFSGRSQDPCHQYLVLTQGNAACATTLDRYFGGISASVTLDNATPDKVKAQPSAAVTPTGNTTSIPSSTGVLSLLAEGRTVTSWGFRYELYNKRDARNPAFAVAWKDALAKASLKSKADDLAKAINSLTQSAAKDPAFGAWQEATKQRLSGARQQGWNALQDAWQESLMRLSEVKAVTDLPQAKNYEAARTAFIAEENKLLKQILEKPIFSLEYANLRPLNQPELSNLKLLVSKPFHVDQPQEGGFTFNVGADLYNTIPKGAKVGHLRDVSAALQWDIPIAKDNSALPTIFTLAGYYQYQVEPGLITIGQGDLAPGTSIQLPSDAKTLLTPKGGMGIVQAKLTFKFNDGKTNLPIAISWANRTELIKASEIRGHIGIQFDWSKLLGGRN